MYDNSYYYSYDLGDYGSSSSGLFATFGAFSWIISMAISVLIIISMWKIFDKCGEKGWKSIIPIYNVWVFFKICDLPGWLCLIPFANTVCLFISYYRIAIKLGKGSGLGVLNIFFPVICMPILAFSKTNNYQNVSNVNNNQSNINNAQENINNIQKDINSIAAEQQRLEQESMNYEATKTCPNCNNTCSIHAKFCGNCGYDFQNK